MAKKHKKSTMPAIIPNQPYPNYWHWWCGDGAKQRAENYKNQRNKRRLINNPEQKAKTLTGFRNLSGLKTAAKPRTATRTRNYPQVRIINN